MSATPVNEILSQMPRKWQERGERERKRREREEERGEGEKERERKEEEERGGEGLTGSVQRVDT